jgi:hypothetical protein
LASTREKGIPKPIWAIRGRELDSRNPSNHDPHEKSRSGIGLIRSVTESFGAILALAPHGHRSSWRSLDAAPMPWSLNNSFDIAWSSAGREKKYPCAISQFELLEQIYLLFRLGTFGDDLQTEIMGKNNDDPDDLAAFRVAVHMRNKGAVDFQRVHWNPAQRLRDEYPVPKSSMLKHTPSAFNCERT